ncbi:MAG: DnaD domain protein [bacterium]
MYFEANNSVLYSDTTVPDVFITEYLPTMSSEGVKIYVYILFMSKHNKSATPWEISKNLNIDLEKVKDALLKLEDEGVTFKEDKKTRLVDLKEKEIRKLYRLKTTSSPTEALENALKNKKRNEITHAINEKFFQGLMSPSWYTDIDAWFDRYKFDEDVMYTLFQHCYDHKGLAKNYIEKVADSWYSKSIKSGFELDKYYMDSQKTRDIRGKIAKKLKLGRMLTEYEEDMVDKWCGIYNYDFDIIELVLKRTTGKTSPNFNYIHAVLTDWNTRGFRTKEQIMEYTTSMDSKKSSASKTYANANTNTQSHNNFDQREYSAEDLDKYYVDVSE